MKRGPLKRDRHVFVPRYSDKRPRMMHYVNHNLCTLATLSLSLGWVVGILQTRTMLFRTPARRRGCTTVGQVHRAHCQPYQPLPRIHALALAKCSLIHEPALVSYYLTLCPCHIHEVHLDNLPMEAIKQLHLLHRPGMVALPSITETRSTRMPNHLYSARLGTLAPLLLLKAQRLHRLCNHR